LAKFKFALSQTEQIALASTLTDDALCYFPDKFAPSIALDNMYRAASYNGVSSTCDAVPPAETQRLCCCSPTGYAVSE
jgi:hypothetical protein